MFKKLGFDQFKIAAHSFAMRFVATAADVNVPSLPVAEATGNKELTRLLVIRLITSGASLTTLLIITYYGIKILSEQLDPTKKEKAEERRRVSFWWKKTCF